jgi:pimeloyl-ACP methyl ester carboxylesterase
VSAGPPTRTSFDEGRTVRVGEVDLWCHDTETGGEPLVLLGGLSVGHFHFDLVRPHLADYRLVTWEPRGFGRSSTPDPAVHPYSVDVWASDLHGLLDALGIQRAYVWANGFSSYIAFALAARLPERIRALVTSTDVWAADPQKGYAGVWPIYGEIIGRYGTRGEGAERLARVYAVTDPSWFVDWFAEAAAEVLHADTAAATIGYCCTEADVRDRLGDIAAPVLVLLGDRSWDGSPLDLSVDPSLDLLRTSIPGVEVVTVHAHPVHLILQEPEETAAIVREFLARYPLDRADPLAQSGTDSRERGSRLPP